MSTGLEYLAIFIAVALTLLCGVIILLLVYYHHVDGGGKP